MAWGGFNSTVDGRGWLAREPLGTPSEEPDRFRRPEVPPIELYSAKSFLKGWTGGGFSQQPFVQPAAFLAARVGPPKKGYIRPCLLPPNHAPRSTLRGGGRGHQLGAPPSCPPALTLFPDPFDIRSNPIRRKGF